MKGLCGEGEGFTVHPTSVIAACVVPAVVRGVVTSLTGHPKKEIFMPFKSEAQRRKMAELERQGKVKSGTCMRVMVIDFETQGPDPKVHLPTEVGAVLVEIPTAAQRAAFAEFPDTEVAKGWAADGFVRELGRVSELIWHTDYPPQPAEIVELTGITDEMLRERGLAPSEAFRKLEELMLFGPERQYPDVILAHNAAFDRGIFEASRKRLGFDPFTHPWLCTVTEVPWPRKFKCKKLSHLAFDHGIQADVTKLHRADYDCDLLIELLLKHYDFHKVLEYWRTPWAVLRAVVPAPWEDGGVGTGHAKALGFGWEKVWGTELTFPKCWVKRVKETEIEAIKAQAPFKLMRLEIKS